MSAFLVKRNWKGVLGLVMGGTIPLVALCLINWIQFGNLLSGGYGSEAWKSSPPLWLGLSGLLIAPSRG